MLGSLSEADDAAQEAWFRLSRRDPSGIENLGGWLTTVVARVCLTMLQSRTFEREEPLDAHMPDPIVSLEDGMDPSSRRSSPTRLGSRLVVLDTLAPAKRLAFVLHDMFDVPFDEIAPVVGRSSDAARQLASRARRRIKGAAPVPDPDLARQREVVEAFLPQPTTVTSRHRWRCSIPMSSSEPTPVRCLRAHLWSAARRLWHSRRCSTSDGQAARPSQV